MLILGGNCEPLSAFRNLGVNLIPSPFDWLGISTNTFPDILKSDWYKDVFSIENIISYSSSNTQLEKYIGVRDLKYKISSIHHFKKIKGMQDLAAIEQQLPFFREKIADRQKALISPKIVFYSEFYPSWSDPPIDKALERVCDVLYEKFSNSKIIIISEKQMVHDKVAIVFRKKIKDYYKLNQDLWMPVWKYINDNKTLFESGKIYQI